MGDAADKAAELQQAEIDSALRRREDEGPAVVSGACNWCLAPVGPRQKFCDSECEQEWSRDRALRARR